MWLAAQPERKNIPFGIWDCQNVIGSPNVCTSSPLTVSRLADAESPYGPAPMMATSHVVILCSLASNKWLGKSWTVKFAAASWICVVAVDNLFWELIVGAGAAAY